MAWFVCLSVCLSHWPCVSVECWLENKLPSVHDQAIQWPALSERQHWRVCLYVCLSVRVTAVVNLSHAESVLSPITMMMLMMMLMLMMLLVLLLLMLLMLLVGCVARMLHRGVIMWPACWLSTILCLHLRVTWHFFVFLLISLYQLIIIVINVFV